MILYEIKGSINMRTALENVIQREKIKELANYFGKITLDIDLDKLRKR